MFSLFGQFGGEGWKNFDILHHYHSDIWEGASLQVSRGNHINAAIGQGPNSFFFPSDAPFEDTAKKHLFAIQGYIWSESSFPKDIQAAQDLISEVGEQLLSKESLNLPDEWGGIYVLAAMDLRTGKLCLSCDPSGIIPMYFCQTNDGALLFSTHLRPLAKTINADVDEIGVIQHHSLHYSIGRRTLFKGIFRINPGETMCFDKNRAQPKFEQAYGIYSRLDKYKSDYDAVDVLWQDFLNGLKPFRVVDGVRGISLSGGLDSRLVAAGFHHYRSKLQTITMGEIGNHEVTVAQSIGKLVNTENIIHTPIKEYKLSQKELMSLIDQVEFANFPHTNKVAELYNELGAATASTGFAGDALLGGQAYILLGDAWKKHTRLKNVLKRSLGLSNNFSTRTNNKNLRLVADNIFLILSSSIESNYNRLNKEWLCHKQFTIDSLREEIYDEINRYSKNSPETLEQIAERFYLDHHYIKHFARSELTLMAKIPVLLPTSYHVFWRHCSNLDPSRKTDHGIYFKLVKKKMHDFAQIPTANIPIKLTNPEFFLWFSRALRANKDQQFTSKLMKSKGNYHGQRYGWANFETWLRQSGFFNDISQFISWELFDKETVENKISRIINWEARAYSGQDFLTMATISKMLDI